MPQYMNCEHNGDGWCINCVTDLQEKIDRLKTQLACCADLVNSWCRETHIAESGSPYDGLELRDAVDRLWSTLAGRLSDSEKEVERLRAELSLVRGAMAAQDERERKAGERCGVPYEQHGCDWPEWVADEVLKLRERLKPKPVVIEDMKFLPIHDEE
jgi:hypothetical protein